MEKNNQYLKKAIQELPTLTLPKESWSVIAKQLDTDIEYNKSMLDQAIIQLQDKKPPNDQWPPIKLKLTEGVVTTEYNKQALDKAILHLPTLEANMDQQWLLIEQQLTDHPAMPLQTAVEGLPELNAPDFIWDNIENQLESKETKVVSLGRNYQSKWIRIAACFLLFISAALFFWINGNTGEQGSATTVTIAFSEEDATDTNNWTQTTTTANSYENWEQANDFITAYCSSLPPECANPEFSAIQEQLHNIESQCFELKNKMDQASDNVELYTYLVRLEKQKNELTKALIQMIVT